MKTFQKGVFVEGAQKASMTEKGEKLLGQQEIEALIPEGGTKFYKHEIMFTFNSSTVGDIGIAGIAMPIYIINKKSSPYILHNFYSQLGDNYGTIMMCNDDRTAFTTIRYNSGGSEMKCFTSIADAYIFYKGIGGFTDTVTPL